MTTVSRAIDQICARLGRVCTRLGPLALLAACGRESDQLTFQPQAHAVATSQWSAAVNLGATINSPSNDLQPNLSPDGLSLYFTSNRAGGLGSNDIWVARRVCTSCPWGTPINVAVLNSTGMDGGAALSDDGHLLFFTSSRTGNNDLHLARRADPNDDFDWEAPIRLTGGVNTAAVEAKPFYRQNAEVGAPNLYFNRGPNITELNDIYVIAVTRDGETIGPAILVTELSDAVANDQGAWLRGDAREVFFQSDRAPSLGAADLWTSTRRSVHHPWSTPVRVDALSSAGSDRHPMLWDQGRVIIFASTRTGGLGGDDLWMSTRSLGGR